MAMEMAMEMAMAMAMGAHQPMRVPELFARRRQAFPGERSGFATTRC